MAGTADQTERAIEVSLSAAGATASCRWGRGALAPGRPWTAGHLGAETTVRVLNAETEPGTWLLELEAVGLWHKDVVAEVRIELAGEEPGSSLWPRYQGFFERRRAAPERGEFRGAGLPAGRLGDTERLSLPLAVVETRGGAFLAGIDPSFSSTITVEPSGERPAAVVFSWTWLAVAGVHDRERRRLFVVAVEDAAQALDRWFELATPDIPKGPAWLHEIALNNYDYLSKNGRGWFADIDAACELIAPEDRHRAIFCLHAWYDEVGRYCYDPVRCVMDEEWIAVPHIGDEGLRARQTSTPVQRSMFPSPGNYVLRNLDCYSPVEMSWDEVRNRLRYAKEHGFRVAVYCLTGMESRGERQAKIADGTGLETDAWLWTGPDLIAPVYVRNPLHPDVRREVVQYVEALLDKVGDLADALVMDEGYYVGIGALGPPACPGYADRAQLELVRELAAACHRRRPELAFMTADVLGMTWLENQAFAYSLYADGIYQDSHCWPQAWDCARFPAWRNVVWSCNWAPVSNLQWTRWGVLAHGAPVALGHGCFGDDIGLAEMDPDTRAEIADLWRLRLTRNLAPRLPIAEAESG